MKKKSSLFRIIPSKTRNSFNHKTLLHYLVVRPLRILVYALDKTPSILSIRRCHLSKSTCEVGSQTKRDLYLTSVSRGRVSNGDGIFIIGATKECIVWKCVYCKRPNDITRLMESEMDALSNQNWNEIIYF